MLEILGVLLFGASTICEWSKDEQAEHRVRQSAQRHNVSYYVDKYGRQRWTSTGRKRTAEEIWQCQVEFDRKQTEQREKVLAEKIKQDEFDTLKRFREKYELFVIHKDNLSFEEFVVLHMSPIHLKYESFRKMKENVSEERLKEIKSNLFKFG